MIPINIDLNVENAPVRAGIVGEHNARELHITPPVELLTADYYRAVFGFTPNAVYTERLGELEDGEERGDTVLTVPLVMELTGQNQTTMTLEAYKNDGTYLGKSRLVHIFFEPAVGGTPTDVTNQPYGIAVEVADLQSRVSQIEQGGTGDGTSTGGGILTVDTVDDLPDDAADGTLAMVRFVDRTGQLMHTPYIFYEKDKDGNLTGEYERYTVTTPSGRLYASNQGIDVCPDLEGAEWTIVTMSSKVNQHPNYSSDPELILNPLYMFVLGDAIGIGTPQLLCWPTPILDENAIPEWIRFFAPVEYDDPEEGIHISAKEDTWYRVIIIDDDGFSLEEVFLPDLLPAIAGVVPIYNPLSEDNYDTAGGDTSAMMEWISKVFAHKPFYDVLFVRHGDTWIERS